MKIVLKIGGSILYSGDKINRPLVKEYVDMITELQEKGINLAVVVGGGKAARDFIGAADHLNVNKSLQDWLGIEAARQNARLFCTAFKHAYPTPPTSYEELMAALMKFNLVFVGGLQPGQSTNAVAAVVAETMRADYIFNLTDVEYVYDKDPDSHPEAKKLEEVSYSDFFDIISQNEQNPGTYALFDVVAAQVIERSKIILHFVNGRTPRNVIEVLNGKRVGTVVRD